MSDLPLRIAGAIAAAGTIYFIVQWLVARSELSQMTKVELAQAEIREGERKARRRNPAEWARHQLLQAGYRGDPEPVAVGLGFAYLAVSVALTFAGVPSTLAFLLGMPGTVGVAYITRQVWWSRRRKTFAFQLKQLFDLLRGQLEAGFGTQRAMEMVVPNLADPLRGEFQAALDSTRAGKDLIEALSEVRTVFPSRGFDLFIAALEVDREQGGSLSKTLQRASDMLGREFKLTEQSAAELAQSKQTFYGVGAILMLIAVTSITGADETAREAYFSVAGLITLGVLAANAAWGVVRVLKILNKAGGEI